VTVHVTGAALRDTTVFRLEQSGIPRATATLVHINNSTDLRVRFNLTGVAPGRLSGYLDPPANVLQSRVLR
jgi:hypothetical protein